MSHTAPALARTNTDRLEHFAWFCERFVVLDNLHAFVIEPFQRTILESYFAGVTETLVLLPKKNGKCLAVDTPIPTPSGWTAMGVLQAGDEIFDEAGQPCRVTFATKAMHGHHCYRVTFSDKTSVIADGDHLWRTRTLKPEGGHREWTTREIARTLRRGDGAANHSIDLAGPLDTQPADLPIEPYVLGVWLGDGATAGGRVTFGEPFVRDELKRLGWGLSHDHAAASGRTETRTVYGLAPALRRLGVLGDKRIPDGYLRGSIEQRVALLQGLMDTDGSISEAGQAEFVTVKPRLRDDALELLRSLGFKPGLSITRARLYGRDCGECYRITFWAFAGRPVFRMPRKRTRQRARVQRRARSETRQIVAVDPVASVPVRCIQVDSPSSLYLCGAGMVPTHNTTLMAALALHHLIFTSDAEIYIAANVEKQANILYRQARGFIERRIDGELLPQAKSLQTRVVLKPGTREIRSRRDGGFLQVISGEASNEDGLIPTLAFVDELHRHKDGGALYGVLADGLGPKDGRMVSITTAGESPRSVLGRIRADALRMPGTTRDGTYVHAREPDGSFELHEWSLLPTEDREDLAVVKRANPLAGNTIEKLGRRKKSPSMTTSRWARFGCGVWMQGEDAAYSTIDWERNARPGLKLARGTAVYLGLDIGWRWDSTAIVPCEPYDVEDLVIDDEEGWWRYRRVRLGKPKIIIPPLNGASTARQEIVDGVLYFRDVLGLEVLGVVFDRNAEGESVAGELENDHDMPVIEHSQKAEPMANSSMGFGVALGDDLVEHPDDDEFSAHILACKTHKVGSGELWRIDHPISDRGKRKKGQEDGENVELIDAGTATVMVHAVATAPHEPNREPLLAWR